MNGINIFSEIFLDMEILKHLWTEDNDLRDRIIEEMVAKVEALIELLTDEKERAKATAAAHDYRRRDNEIQGL